MADRSSRPHHSSARTPTRTERHIIKGRVLRRWGPARIGYLLGLHPSTVHRVSRNARNHTRARSRSGHPVIGYHYLHTALDDHSRLAYSELLADERKDTAAAFWSRAAAWFTGNGVTIATVLTDNGSCYRSRTFAEALGPVVHKRTRPYRPQTNGKVCEYFWDARIGRSDPDQGMTAVSFVRFVDRLDAGVDACAGQTIVT